MPARARDDVVSLQRALLDCRPDNVPPPVQIDRLTEGLEPLLRRRYANAEVRLRDLEALSRLASGYESRAQALAELTLDPPASTGDLAGPPELDDDYLILSTVHSAKGGEWRVVHLIHAADGMFPSDLATGDAEGVEEERRLFYVALTRAREHLHIYAPLRFHHNGPFGLGRRPQLRPADPLPAAECRSPSRSSPGPGRPRRHGAARTLGRARLRRGPGPARSVVRPAGLAQAQGDRAHRPLPPPGLGLQPHRGRVLGLG